MSIRRKNGSDFEKEKKIEEERTKNEQKIELKVSNWTHRSQDEIEWGGEQRDGKTDEKKMNDAIMQQTS